MQERKLPQVHSKRGFKYTASSLPKLKFLAMINVEARDLFRSKKVTTLIIKYTYGFNHHILRDAMINDNMAESAYPRNSQIET